MAKKRKVIVLETPHTQQSNYKAGGCKLRAMCPICKRLTIIHILKRRCKPVMMEECKYYYEIKDVGISKPIWQIRFRKIKSGPKPVVEKPQVTEQTLFRG